jgi:hypothetical protein
MADPKITGVDWDLVNEDAATWARDFGGDLVKKIDEGTRRDVGNAVGNFYSEGQTMGELTGRLGRIYSPQRAERIAITEVTRAAAEGERGIAKELAKDGVVMVEVWQTRNDSVVCEICRPRNGVEQYKGDGDAYWDSSQGPPGHPNCRCNIRLDYPEPKEGELAIEVDQELIVNTYPEDRLYKSERNPTEAEIANFKNIVDDLPPSLQRIRPTNDDIWVTVERGRAEARGNRILIDGKFLTPNSQVAKHEYLHTAITNNKAIDNTIIDKYEPPRIFKHADVHGLDIQSANGENLVMNLSAFDENRDIWISQVKSIESWVRVQSTADALMQVEAVEEYLQLIGLW